MKAALGALLAFVVMSCLVFGLSIAPWYILGLDVVLRPSGFDTGAMMTFYLLVVSAVSAIAGGWIAARVGKSRLSVIILAILGLLAGIVNGRRPFEQTRAGAPSYRSLGYGSHFGKKGAAGIYDTRRASWARRSVRGSPAGSKKEIGGSSPELVRSFS